MIILDLPEITNLFILNNSELYTIKAAILIENGKPLVMYTIEYDDLDHEQLLV